MSFKPQNFNCPHGRGQCVTSPTVNHYTAIPVVNGTTQCDRFNSCLVSAIKNNLRGDKGDTGPRGEKGDRGDRGEAGADGCSISIKGSFDSVEELIKTHLTAQLDDAYLINGDLWLWDGLAWKNAGNIQGPQGIQGEPGAVPEIEIGEVKTVEADEPATVTIEPSSDEPARYFMNFEIPKGEQGEQVPLPEIESVDVNVIPLNEQASAGIELQEKGKYKITFNLPSGKGDDGKVGPTGPAPTIQIGEVLTLPPGSEASAQIYLGDTEGEYLIDFQIPRGEQGETGMQGDVTGVGAVFQTEDDVKAAIEEALKEFELGIGGANSGIQWTDIVVNTMADLKAPNFPQTVGILHFVRNTKRFYYLAEPGGAWIEFRGSSTIQPGPGPDDGSGAPANLTVRIDMENQPDVDSTPTGIQITVKNTTNVHIENISLSHIMQEGEDSYTFELPSGHIYRVEVSRKAYFSAADPGFFDIDIPNPDVKHEVTFTFLALQKFHFGIEIDNSTAAPDGYIRTRYLFDAVGMRPAKMDFETGQFDYGDWEGILKRLCRPVMLTWDGHVDQQLDWNDQTKKLDGTPSDISNIDFPGNAMVEFREFTWVKTTPTMIAIANYQVDSTYTETPFRKLDGTSAERVYIAMFGATYQAAIADDPLGFPYGKFRSIADRPGIGQNIYWLARSDYRQAPAIGTDAVAERWMPVYERLGVPYDWNAWYQARWGYVMSWLMIISKNTHLLTPYGDGPHKAPTPANVTTTGTLAATGPFYGERKTNNRMKALFMEDLWGNYQTWVNGIYNNGGVRVYVASYQGATIINHGDSGSSWGTNWNRTSVPRNNVFLFAGDNEKGGSEATFYGSANTHKDLSGGSTATDATFVGCSVKVGNNVDMTYGPIALITTRNGTHTVPVLIRMSYPR
ncbi:MAG: collagen-like protein [Holophagales bacterium]|nr:collagen-like protein [Holophagales bacterium]